MHLFIPLQIILTFLTSTTHAHIHTHSFELNENYGLVLLFTTPKFNIFLDLWIRMIITHLFPYPKLLWFPNYNYSLWSSWTLIPKLHHSFLFTFRPTIPFSCHLLFIFTREFKKIYFWDGPPQWVQWESQNYLSEK